MEAENTPQGVSPSKKFNGVNEGKSTFQLTLDWKGKNYFFRLLFQNPVTRKVLRKEFAILIPENTKNKAFWTKNIIFGAALKYLQSLPRSSLLNLSSKRELGNGIYRLLKNITVRSKGTEILSQFDVEGKKGLESPTTEYPFLSSGDESREKATDTATGSSTGSEGGKDSDGIKLTSSIAVATKQAIESIALPLPKTSIFAPIETGATFAIVGKSKSGKTTFLINNLNLLTDKELNQYNAIIYFTTSPNADPLKGLDMRIRKRFIMVGRFCPRILMILKRLNDETDMMFKFMVIFDDILKLRGDLLSECILTLRNSNISTVLSIQYEKLISPAQRASVHNIYIFNLRTLQWDFFLRGFIAGNVQEVVPPLRPIKRLGEMSQIMREVMNPYILYYDQVNDKTMFYHKRK